MAELPFMKFFSGDWLRDTRFLTPEAKGCWIDTIAVLWDSSNKGLLSHPVCGWARLWGVCESQASEIIDQLSTVAEVVRNLDSVTIANRRMIREELGKEEERNKKRIQRKQAEDFSYLEMVWSLVPDLSRRMPLPCPRDVPDLSPDCPPIVPDTPETRDQRPEVEREGIPRERKIPTVDECEQHARGHAPDHHADFAASVAREFHGVYSSMQPPWTTRVGDDLTRSESWRHKLNSKIESELRNEISRGSHRGGGRPRQSTSPKPSTGAGDGITPAVL